MSLITEGKHRARCRSIQLGYTATGKEQAVVEFELTNPTDADHGRSIFAYMFFSPAAIKYAVKNLRAIGWKGSDPSELPDLAEKGELANEVDIVVEHDTYNGKTNHKVRYVNALGGGVKNPMDDSQRSAFGANLRAQIAAMDGEGDGAGSFESPPVNPDDDLPF